MATSTHLLFAADEARDLQSVLRALTGELDSAAATALDLQESIGALLGRLHAPIPEIYALQAIDRLAQTLADLARFVGAISEGVPESWHIEAARAALALHQRELARRLALPAADDGPVPPAEDDFLLDCG